MSPEIAAILKILGAALSIWDHKLSSKYQRKLLKLRKERFNETDKNPNAIKKKDRPDRNIIDRIDRDIMLIGDLVSSEIKRSKTNSVPK